MPVTEAEIVDGLRGLGVGPSSVVIAHTSLRSFGQVEGGAAAVAGALVSACGTLLVPASPGDLTGLSAPPGLVRPDNAYFNEPSWAAFDEALERATAFSRDLPIDGELGAVPEAVRRLFPRERGDHALFSYVAVGEEATALIRAQRKDRPLGPLEVLAGMDGLVLLLGTDHTSNTMIHLAEQRLGRSLFYRYAKVGDGCWAEFPNIPGESHRFSELEPLLAPVTREARIGGCRARLIAARDVLRIADREIKEDPRAFLCDAPGCRCQAALRQRLSAMRSEAHATNHDG
ncbi:MAG TPA: AAC(3) family N-acetyltransferase [Candidatus Dormibacteraeota bacterium]|jgi:aminoglycoside 3-N-acetyltransferase|nr:AAC(3) family N-acetyltransferase [Candidatus Dormibacteraeota bacterium]